MDNLILLILLGIGTLLLLFFIVVFVTSFKKYDDIIGAIDPKEFLLPELYFIGFGVLDLVKFNINTERGKKREAMISEIKGEKYAAFYRYVILGGQVTYGLIFLILACLIPALANDVIFAPYILIAGALLVIYLDYDIDMKVQKRRDELLSDFPYMLSELTLLINAGLVLREAWKKVAYSKDSIIYQEMQKTAEEMENGVSDEDALIRFGDRCSVREIRKFVSSVIQNLKKGGMELVTGLRYMTKESLDEKRNRVKTKGQQVETKLLIPLLIMFGGILIMIIVPIFESLAL